MDNPLLKPAFPIPYDRVNAKHVAPAIDALLHEARSRIDAIIQDETPRGFDNTILALEAITENLDYAIGIVSHLESTASSAALREAINEAKPRVSELCSTIPLSSGLYQALENYLATDNAKSLQGPRKRCAEKWASYFRRHGAALDDAGKQRLTEIEVALTTHCLQFSQNVLDATHAFELSIQDESRLKGLPESAKSAARQSAESKGQSGYRFTLQAPSYIAAMKHLDDRDLREAMYRGMTSRCSSEEHDNRPLVRAIVALRSEKAKLLSFDHFADFITEERMAKSGERARLFVEDLKDKTVDHFRSENDALLDHCRAALGPENTLQAWDLAYQAEKLRVARYQFDDEVLRPYFRFDRGIAGLFDIAASLYSIRFEPWGDAPTWDDSVRAYKILNAEERWIAGIYVDAFPRESKQGGAWMNGLLARHGGMPTDWPHLGLLAANVTPAVGDKEPQLTHREVETLFHEFGHLMHHCLSTAEIRSQVGTSVAWDFVELPSQMFENWCWERAALDRFARHPQSGEAIPNDLLEAMSRARTFRAANGQMRQLGLAMVDLRLHIDDDPQPDPVTFARNVLQAHSPVPLPKDYAIIAAFDHLFGDPVGYAAGYYSYKWAEVLDADAFTRFKKEGIFNSQTGAAFRDAILARGDEEDPGTLFQHFMGRDPEQRPLLDRLGLNA